MVSKLCLKKMRTEYQSPIQYYLCDINLNPFIGNNIRIKFINKLNCLNCNLEVKKLFQGYCFQCSQKLACCDICQVRPEKCHYHLGTCREPEWGKENCFIDHSVYLALTSGVKVGITRSYQKINRWIDQGAIYAAEILNVKSRLEAGLIEIELSQNIPDKTNWRNLLTGKDSDLKLENLAKDFNLEIGDIFTFKYPIVTYLNKAKTWDLEKDDITGVFHGIRGQYLFIGDAAINIRKYQGYNIELYD